MTLIEIHQKQVSKAVRGTQFIGGDRQTNESLNLLIENQVSYFCIFIIGSKNFKEQF